MLRDYRNADHGTVNNNKTRQLLLYNTTIQVIQAANILTLILSETLLRHCD